MSDSNTSPLPHEASPAEVLPEGAAEAQPAVATPPAAEAAASVAVQTPAECAQELKKRFPALFAGPAKPLKLRIQADIQARAPGVFSKQLLSAFLRRHTGATSYLIAVSKSTQRFDLDGQPAGELSEEHRELAREELTRRRAKTQERQAAEEAELRSRAELLRAFETTTLTLSNFCALKGVAPEALDGLLAQARAEREVWQQQRAQMPQRQEGRRGPGPAEARRGDARGPRGDGRRDERGRGGRPQGQGGARQETGQGRRPEGGRGAGRGGQGTNAAQARGPRPQQRAEAAPAAATVQADAAPATGDKNAE
ncbi:ProQ/FinO family protein [Paucibacter sp. APW11]|uniref:ProQ/FinO family protein n=1 Tax=Roseateles aquae TaxID=3077235 RepID=A0ABU3PBA3_9BURK|nr:ProQ/FinO family protein [Paucibacter sp. APW11]MDT8999844.1 ProQ/FinO family protein [Paucibacter sp. APW11]